MDEHHGRPMMMAALLLFLSSAVAISATWNFLFAKVPWRYTLLFIAIVCMYQATTLFTPRVDFPADLSFVSYPWKSIRAGSATANTGIVLTQIGPWTRVARDAIRSGEWPLWNRYADCGAPLLASQQTAIFHPFTLIGFLLISFGKAFTFTASIRLFTVLCFTFIFLRSLSLAPAAAIYGSVAYAFCTFHIVWLLFPLGLATMMLPVALAGAQQFAEQPRLRSFLLLTSGLSLSVLGGHPESAFWVWALTAAYVVSSTLPSRPKLLFAALAFITAACLTAFAWLPTAALLDGMDRTAIMRSRVHNPANHHLGSEWLETLIAPNLLGTPQNGSWKPPAHRHPTVLDDYGEISSGYPGIVTLALASSALWTRRRLVLFFAGVMLFAFLTIAEVPLWRDLVRALPVAGLTMQQRLRVFWALGAAVLAAFGWHEQIQTRRLRSILLIAWMTVAIIHAIRSPVSMTSWVAFGAASAAVLIVFMFPRNAMLATLVTFAELFVVTFHYNPSAAPEDVFPDTPAIRVARLAGMPGRTVAIGWSLQPDTPSYYALEDIKSTNPLTSSAYKRLMHGFLHVVPSYDEIVPTLGEPFADFLNIRTVYVPPDVDFNDARLEMRHRGPDGIVFENPRALPRYFVPLRYRVNTALPHAIATLKEIRDFSADSVVDHVPARIAELAPQLAAHSVEEWRPSAPGTVRLLSYRNNSTTLQVQTSGWSLLASSDAFWPGWRAYVNGQREPPVTVNGAFVGCFVPPGRNIVELRYRPAEFDMGLRMSEATILALAIAVSIRMLKKIRP